MGRGKPDGSENEDRRQHGEADIPLPGEELGGIPFVSNNSQVLH